MDLDINIAEEIIKLWKSRIYTNIMTEVALGRGGKNDREEGKKITLGLLWLSFYFKRNKNEKCKYLFLEVSYNLRFYI